MPHLDDGMIHELLDGEVPSSELPPVTAHLAGCAECRVRLERAQAMMAEADKLIETLDLPVAAPAQFSDLNRARAKRPARWIQPVAWAASLALAAGVGYAARGNLAIVPPPSPVAGEAPLQRADKLTTTPAPGVATREIASPSPAPAPAPARLDQPAAKANAAAPPDRATALAEAAKPAADARERTEPAAPLVAPAPAAAGGSAGTLRDAVSGNSMLRADEARALAPRNAVTSKQLIDGVFDRSPPRTDTIQLPDAMRLLGGRIRLVDGAVPKRLEAQGTEVRVIYSVATGELILSEQLLDGVITWRLTGPREFNADSLAKLRKLVRE